MLPTTNVCAVMLRLSHFGQQGATPIWSPLFRLAGCPLDKKQMGLRPGDLDPLLFLVAGALSEQAEPLYIVDTYITIMIHMSNAYNPAPS
jgi:hypothetical protein